MDVRRPRVALEGVPEERERSLGVAGEEVLVADLVEDRLGRSVGNAEPVAQGGVMLHQVGDGAGEPPGLRVLGEAPPFEDLAEAPVVGGEDDGAVVLVGHQLRIPAEALGLRGGEGRPQPVEAGRGGVGGLLVGHRDGERPLQLLPSPEEPGGLAEDEVVVPGEGGRRGDEGVEKLGALDEGRQREEATERVAREDPAGGGPVASLDERDQLLGEEIEEFSGPSAVGGGGPAAGPRGRPAGGGEVARPVGVRDADDDQVGDHPGPGEEVDGPARVDEVGVAVGEVEDRVALVSLSVA